MASVTDRIPPAVKIVTAYRNLTTGTWSAKAVDGPAATRGKLVAHPTSLELTDCTFHVRAGGRADTRRTCSKWVHAWARGTVGAMPTRWPKALIVEVTYNPYLFDTFVLVSNARPVERAAWIEFPEATGRGKVKPLRVGLYEDDARIIDLAPVKPVAARIARMLWCRQTPAERERDQARGREPPIPNPLTLRAALLTADWNG